MRNALADSADLAVLPEYSVPEAVVDLRIRIQTSELAQRHIWASLEQQLLLALQKHSHEIHIDEVRDGVRIQIKTITGLSEYRFTAGEDICKAVKLLQSQLWPSDTPSLAQRSCFLIHLNSKDLLYQADRLVTSSGNSLTFRRLYDLHNPLPVLEQLFKLPSQSTRIRTCLHQAQGLILLADTDRITRVKTARAMAQVLIGPQRRVLLAETSCHPLVSGVAQVSLPLDSCKTDHDAWQRACDMCHDVVIALDVDHAPEQLIRQASNEQLIIQGISASTPSQALTNLVAGGIRPEAIARVLNYIVVQQAIACVCQHCKSRSAVDNTLNDWINQHSPVRPGAIQDWLTARLNDNFVEADGCSACHHTGIEKILLSASCIKTDKELQGALYDGDIRFAVDYLDNVDPLVTHIVSLARQGVVSVKFALNRLQQLQA